MSEGMSHRAAAKVAGVSKTAIGKAIESGHLLALPGGQVTMAALENWSAGRRAPRGGNPATSVAAPVATPKKSAAPAPRCAPVAESDDDDPDAVAGAAMAILKADGTFLDRAAAELWRDSFVARSRQLQYEIAAGKVIEVEHVARVVGESLARVRTRLLAIPAEQAPRLHRLKTVTELQDAILECITEALTEMVEASAFDGADGLN